MQFACLVAAFGRISGTVTFSHRSTKLVFMASRSATQIHGKERRYEVVAAKGKSRSSTVITGPREVQVKEFWYAKMEFDLLEYYLPNNGDFILNGVDEVSVIYRWEGRVRNQPMEEWNQDKNASEKYILDILANQMEPRGIQLHNPVTKANTTFLLGYENFVGTYTGVVSRDGHFGDVLIYDMQYADFGSSKPKPLSQVAAKILNPHKGVKVQPDLIDGFVKMARAFAPFTQRDRNCHIAPCAIFIRKSTLIVCTELMTPLISYLVGAKGSRKVLRSLCYQAALGMLEMVRLGFNHGSLCIMKCMMAKCDGEDVLRISGYLAKFYDTRDRFYDAPELRGHNREQKANEAADVFSYGVFLLDVFSGAAVTKGVGMTVTELQDRAQSEMDPEKFFKVGLNGDKFLVPEGMPKELVELARSCMATEPANRPTFAAICKKFERSRR